MEARKLCVDSLVGVFAFVWVLEKRSRSSSLRGALSTALEVALKLEVWCVVFDFSRGLRLST